MMSADDMLDSLDATAARRGSVLKRSKKEKDTVCHAANKVGSDLLHLSRLETKVLIDDVNFNDELIIHVESSVDKPLG